VSVFEPPIGHLSSREVAVMLYALQFPNRKFDDLDVPVQYAYEIDAKQLLAMLREAVT